MPADGGAITGKAFVAVVKFFREIRSRLSIGDELKREKADFADRCVEELLKSAQNATAHAHRAILMSSNDPKGQDAHLAAVVEGSAVCRRATAIFSNRADCPALPGMLLQAIEAYRDAVTNDENLEVVEPKARATRVAALDDATLYLETEVRRSAFRTMGVGTGAWTARSAARGKPERS